MEAKILYLRKEAHRLPLFLLQVPHFVSRSRIRPRLSRRSRCPRLRSPEWSIISIKAKRWQPVWRTLRSRSASRGIVITSWMSARVRTAWRLVVTPGIQSGNQPGIYRTSRCFMRLDDLNISSDERLTGRADVNNASTSICSFGHQGANFFELFRKSIVSRFHLVPVYYFHDQTRHEPAVISLISKYA